METFDFHVFTSGHVRIDAESEEAATKEFVRTFAQEAVLVTARQDQILVLDGIVYEDPTTYTEPELDSEEETDSE